MSELRVDYENSVCSNAQVYGYYESVAASKYPFLTDVEEANPAVTKTVKNLALAPAGSGEDTFMNGIVVQMDVTMSMKAWVELQRYHFIDFVSSQSTMHCITKFNIVDQLDDNTRIGSEKALEIAVNEYMQSKSSEDFLTMMYSIPSGFRYTARMTTNYRQLKTIYRQRKNHRLTHDWKPFCEWIEHLPFSWMITGKDEDSFEIEHVEHNDAQMGREK